MPEQVSQLAHQYVAQAFVSGDLVAFEYASNDDRKQRFYDVRMIRSAENESACYCARYKPTQNTGH